MHHAHDIAYGPRPRETIDLLFPERVVRAAPLHVFVHGGYWRSGDKADYRFVAETPLAAGAITALVEYDLMPGQRLPVLVDQVRRALRWLQENAGSFGADPPASASAAPPGRILHFPRRQGQGRDFLPKLAISRGCCS